MTVLSYEHVFPCLECPLPPSTSPDPAQPSRPNLTRHLLSECLWYFCPYLGVMTEPWLSLLGKRPGFRACVTTAGTLPGSRLLHL